MLGHWSCFGGIEQWLSMDVLRLHDQFLVIRFRTKYKSLGNSGWEWVDHFAKIDELCTRMIRAHKATLRKIRLNLALKSLVAPEKL